MRFRAMPPSPERRGPVAALAERQAALALALSAHSAPPAGFDEVRLSRASAALAGKRAAAAAKLLPALWRSLGAEAAGSFRGYVTAHPFPGDHAPDALAFAAHVCTRRTPADAIREVLTLRVRSGWPLRAGRARRRVMVVARVAGRPRCLGVPWF